MPDQLQEHKHCKRCGNVIPQPTKNEYYLFTMFRDDAEHLIVNAYQESVCKRCIIKEGINSIVKK